MFTDNSETCQRFEALSQQREQTKSNKYIFGSTLGLCCSGVAILQLTLRVVNLFFFPFYFSSVCVSLCVPVLSLSLCVCISVSILVENLALSQLESLSQHIPKEILLSQENVQLSNVIGEGSHGGN